MNNIPLIKIISGENNFDEKDCYVITQSAAEALKARDDPLSNGTIKRIKKEIGGEWMVFASVEGLKGYDFHLSSIRGRGFISFVVQNFRFQVCRVESSDLYFGIFHKNEMISNIVDIPTFELISKGNYINEKEYYVITHSALDALDAKEDPLSNGIAERIKKEIGGCWMVFASIKGLKGYDFCLSISNQNNALSFSIQYFIFKVCKY